jgi:hypothetical protein
MLECVRQSGRWNMFTEWKRACLSAFALSVYLGQPLDGQCVRLSQAEIVAAYKDKGKASPITSRACPARPPTSAP